MIRNLAFLLLIAAAAPAWCDDWAQPRARIFASPQGIHALTVTPTSFQEATGRLIALADDGTPKEIWNAKLVNVPMRVWVSGEGDNVITVDTYGNLGYAHSLVIYDGHGKAIADYRLEDLLTDEELRKHTIRTAGSRWWAGDAKFRLVSTGRRTSQFLIQLPWGKRITADLQTGKLEFRSPGAPAPPGERARAIPAGVYTGAALAMQVADSNTTYNDKPPAICHFEVLRNNRVKVAFPDPVLGRGEWTTKTLPLSTTAPRYVWKLVDGDTTFQATAVEYSPRSLMLRVEIVKAGKRVGGALQFYGVEPE